VINLEKSTCKNPDHLWYQHQLWQSVSGLIRLKKLAEITSVAKAPYQRKLARIIDVNQLAIK